MDEFIKFSSNMVQLNKESQINEKELDESFASLLLNPYVSWAKFILTDDEPNGNGKRIPKEEFGNLINSGIYMPIKMSIGKIEGHETAIPIGVITHLKEVKNRVEGLAALWDSERPEDVSLLKDLFNENHTLNISWEIGYKEAKENSEYDNLVQDLFGTRLKAATLVETPAYGGRTPILALSEKEDIPLEEKEKLLDKIKKLEESLSKTQEKNSELRERLEKAEQMEEELESLREFKAEIEQEREREERLEEIKERFEEAGIEKDDQYFEDHSERLLSMDESSFEFFLQELASFDELTEEDSDLNDEEDDTPEAPRIFGEGDPSKEEIIHYLKHGEEK